ncbi:uncharacterized protein EI90DRAFT_3020460 [Cantharellus anzutake]|uniref:uncharacterized protein n=1 Tax=Cantharellus anzutake TaxID=1750568 RepID=UPI0019035EAC|nr:uncharacterized protein EI90DRAFT_3020460 [Cantharellus anzutake]KAF8321060.1 hypothetical protein EI90DRAFT_3020460 [Cantharellus anzutake]
MTPIIVVVAENEGQLKCGKCRRAGIQRNIAFYDFKQTEYYSDKRNNEGSTDRLHFMPDYSLGAATIKGIEDPDVYPIRGQTVLVRTPWVRFGRTLSEPGVDGIWTYIIPRRSGDPLKEITEDILRRCLELCPELVTGSPEFKSSTSGPEAEGGGTPRKVTVDDLRPFIIEEGCGLRPARKGGIRFEVDWLSAAESTESGADENGRSGKIPVIHHYGHGGFGYQSSWGSAEKAVDLLQTVL